MSCRSLILRKRERIFTERREMRDLLELHADHDAQGEKAAPLKLSEAEYHTRLLLEEQKNHLMSEAQSEARIKSRKRRQGSPWIKPTDSISMHGTLPGESVIWSFLKRERLATGSIQNWRKVQVLFKKPVRELLRKRKKWTSFAVQKLKVLNRWESQSTVNQLTVQIQELQDKGD